MNKTGTSVHVHMGASPPAIVPERPSSQPHSLQGVQLLWHSQDCKSHAAHDTKHGRVELHRRFSAYSLEPKASQHALGPGQVRRAALPLRLL